MTSAAAAPARALIDLLKAAACCLIVLHHLAFYGPMADHAQGLFPAVFDWLAEHARMAVQVFLVVGGYLAGRGLQGRVLASDPIEAARQSLQAVMRRFWRLALPLWVALLLALVANAWADHWMDHESISPWPSLSAWLAHLLLLQDILGHEALSAGVWYVAIDFQLFALVQVMAAAAACSQRPRPVLFALVLALLAVSAFGINRWPQADMWAPYFWASYGLGLMLGLQPPRPWMGAAVGLTMLALVVDFRARLGLALITTALLALGPSIWGHWLAMRPSVQRAVQSLSQISYAVFLVHFPVSLVVNAAWTAFVPPSALLQLLGVITAFKLSLVLGGSFHHFVERPLLRRLAPGPTANAA